MLYLLLAQQHTTEERGSPALFRKQIQLFHGAFLSANKKAKRLADKHLAMYAEGFFFVFSRSVFGFRGFRSFCLIYGLFLKCAFFNVSWVRIFLKTGRADFVVHDL